MNPSRYNGQFGHPCGSVLVQLTRMFEGNEFICIPMHDKQMFTLELGYPSERFDFLESGHPFIGIFREIRMAYYATLSEFLYDLLRRALEDFRNPRVSLQLQG